MPRLDSALTGGRLLRQGLAATLAIGMLALLAATSAASANEARAPALPDQDLLLFLAEFADERGEVIEPELLDQLVGSSEASTEAVLSAPPTAAEPAPTKPTASRRRTAGAAAQEHDDAQH